ncbi:S-layer homology domain-containing protein [Paenibacillus methanolicus]|uniref:S-layer family protein n=1 Tax=Paenibacillus methanolicus TaxID=582686 RepID=A0A5S5C839_9BACL|nr:S-layer homology domain-containing protein [Paenibacillus methanolicus]TYP74153.1 S-layer family protein [Paenibacillus methanolicus]
MTNYEKKRRYTKVAYSMLALSMGLGAVPVSAREALPPKASSLAIHSSHIGLRLQHVPAGGASSRLYRGDSLKYFKNEFLRKPGFSKLLNVIGEGGGAPTATGVSITGVLQVGETLTATYAFHDADNDNEGASVKQWYRYDGSIKTTIPGATGTNYTLTSDDVGKYIVFGVTPVADDTPTTGTEADYTTIGMVSSPAAPTAAPVSISGTAAVGQTLSGSYTYADANSGDTQSGTTFKWYRADDGAGTNKSAIIGATAQSYVPTFADAGKFITFEVTPKNAANFLGTGTPTSSSPTLAVAAAPVASGASVVGTTRVGQTLSASFAYMDANNDPESGSLYQWYRADDGEGMNKNPILGATSASYVLVSADLGKYISFTVIPKNAALLADTGDIRGSEAVGAVAAAITEPASVSYSAFSAQVSEEESLIEVVAVKKNVETSQAAKLNLVKDGNVIERADFNFEADGVMSALTEASVKETIAVRVRSLKGAENVYGNITGDLVQAMADKTQRLAMITGDVAIDFPTVSIPEQLQAGADGMTRETKIELKIEKQPKAVREAAAEWAAGQGAKVIGTSYKFSVKVQNGDKTTSIAQYGDRYAHFTLPLPEGVTDPTTLAAVMLVDGQYVPVPVRIVDQEHAVVETPTNATVTLVQRERQFDDLSGHWGAQDLLFMANKDNIAGEADGKFNAHGNVTRGDLATMLVQSLGLGHRTKGLSGDAGFSDLPEDAAASEAIQLAIGAGLFKGYPDGTFAPEALTTREQLVAVLMRFRANFELELPQVRSESLDASFKDASKGADWSKAYLESANKGGVIKGFENDSLGASRELTRDEAAAIIRRFLQHTNLTN